MTMTQKIFLALNALVWTPYGLVLIFNPELLADMGVFDQSDWVEKVEVRAMYGGAQFAIGLYALIALLKPQQHAASATLFLTLLFVGLASTRFVGLMLEDAAELFALSAEMSASGYNSGALWFFEVPMSLFGGFLILRSQSNATVS
jgi:hypothetical protein